MKFKMVFKWNDNKEDVVFIEGNSIDDIRIDAENFLSKRNLTIEKNLIYTEEV